MPNPAQQACTVCHLAAPTAYTPATLAAVAVLHTGVTAGCAQCHGGTTALTWYSNYTPKDAVLTPAHIPFNAGADCGGCHAATFATGGFGPTGMSAAKHAFVPTTCDTCHDTAPNTFYLGASTPALQTRPADHLASGDAEQKTGDCSLCHNTTNWLSGTLPIGHMPNPGNQACAVCHTGINGTFGGYATMGSITALHTGITANCGQCHGTAATGAISFFNNNDPPKPAVATHIPYLSGADCGVCHANTFAAGGFGPVTMSSAKHTVVSTTCDSCHDVALGTYYTGTAVPLQMRPTDHIKAGGQQKTGDCSACHGTADWSAGVLPPNHMPNPGGQACAVCHTAIGGTLGSYDTMASILVLHTNITGGCALCHGDTAALSFANNNDIPKYAAAVNHIPYLNGVDCSNCHAKNYQSGGFGPATAMSPATHAFVPTTCNTCHDTGKSFFVGTGTALQIRPQSHLSVPPPSQQPTGDCSLCHNTTTWNTPTNLPYGHMPVPGTQTCAVCHLGTLTSDPNSYANMASIPVLHTGITSGCAQCHGQSQLVFYNSNDPPLPAHAQHIPAFTGEDCSSCHAQTYRTGGFGPMNMTQATHNGVGATCNGCHDVPVGTYYLGAANPTLRNRPGDHTATNMAAPNDCSLCHTTANWISSTLPAQHMPNPAGTACNVCHTAAPANFATLAANAVIHTGITNGCAQCHVATVFYNNNEPPKPAPNNHIPYLAGTDCGACHTSATYATGTFGPMNMNQAKHAFVASTCNTCHASAPGALFMGMANPGLQLRPTKDHTTGNMLTGDCGACHTTADWNTTVLPAGHMPNPANLACTTCHLSAPADYTPATLAGNPILHTGISATCGLCHGAQAPLTWYNGYTPKDAVLTPPHIPYAAGTDCSSCHASSTYAAGTFGPMNMTQAKHAYVSTTCNTCHGTAVGALYMGAASPGMQLRPTQDHTTGTMLTGDCSACHTTANWNSTALPAGHMPNPANQACSACHLSAPTDYTPSTLAANSVLHNGIAGNCGQCHGAGTPLTWYNNYTPKDAVLTPAHIPYLSGTDCSSCHASSTYAAGTFGPMNMTQAQHAFVTTACDTCHGTAVGALYMGNANPGMQLRPTKDHTTGTMLTGDCSACHTTANWNSTAMPAGHMPNPANSACTVCHTQAPADYTTATLAANTALHTGITTGCLTCHGAPNTAPPVFYLNYTPKSAVLSPVHIPTGATACQTCHKSTVFSSFAGAAMTSTEHTTMFGTIGSTCDACHNRVTPALNFYGVGGLTTRPQDGQHSSGRALTGDCSGCHSVGSWGGGSAKKKAGVPATARSTVTTVVGPAAAPTAGGTAPVSAGQTPTATGGEAGAAARGVHGAITTHAGVTGQCAGCHDGALAPSKGPTHITSNDTCENCHTTLAWMPARFDHQGVTARCASCHNGAQAPGVPARHIQSSEDCSGCHGTMSWKSAKFSHVGTSTSCVSCHNGVTATAKQPQHARTTLDCGSCHNTVNWSMTVSPVRLKPLLPPLRGTAYGQPK